MSDNKKIVWILVSSVLVSFRSSNINNSFSGIDIAFEKEFLCIREILEMDTSFGNREDSYTNKRDCTILN